MSSVPPPVRPETSSTERRVNATRGASSRIIPPGPLPPRPSSKPDAVNVPSLDSMRIWPPAAPRARIWLVMSNVMSCRAEICTLPPPASVALTSIVACDEMPPASACKLTVPPVAPLACTVPPSSRVMPLVPCIDTAPPPFPPLALNCPPPASVTAAAAFTAISPARPVVAFAVTGAAIVTLPAVEVSVTLPPSTPLAVMREPASTVTPCCPAMLIVPPLPCVEFASTVPATATVPTSDWIVILPADGPLAVITLVLSSVMFCFAISTTSPFSFRAAVLARIVPLLRIIPA